MEEKGGLSELLDLVTDVICLPLGRQRSLLLQQLAEHEALHLLTDLIVQAIDSEQCCDPQEGESRAGGNHQLPRGR